MVGLTGAVLGCVFGIVSGDDGGVGRCIVGRGGGEGGAIVGW